LVRFDALSIGDNYARRMRKRHQGLDLNTKVVGGLLLSLVWLHFDSSYKTDILGILKKDINNIKHTKHIKHIKLSTYAVL
jgi:hypothetical protein